CLSPSWLVRADGRVPQPPKNFFANASADKEYKTRGRTLKFTIFTKEPILVHFAIDPVIIKIEKIILYYLILV
ncbi:MAG: hypothetical protein ABIH18_09730, partial [Candidatus Omnitrophota bacterium]